eukprot:TRINITY_DN1278_c0_g1_i1.p1 TRINITY_DN1278_c0_g1~~TRINITY_DN1278_c0_g1_i1.p1  ORF type:complete len:434 (+),score=51.11 TRINITY_DN1278_c0_g1_i1:117-1418(+)
MANVASAVTRVNLTTYARNLNGPNDYRPAREQYGTIANNKRLALPHGFAYATDYTDAANANVDSNNFRMNAIANTVDAMISANGDLEDIPAIGNWHGVNALVYMTTQSYASYPADPDRLPIALIRGILLSKGFLWDFNADPSAQGQDGRRVYIDETDQKNNLADITKANVNIVLQYMATEQGQAIMRNWTIFPLASAIVFMIRGHHFIGNDTNAGALGASGRYTYSGLYRSIMSSLVDVSAFGITDMRSIFYDALHPFGVNVFWRFLKHMEAHRRLPAQLVLRATSSPAGQAKITTAAAIARVLGASSYMARVSINFNASMVNIYAASQLVLTRPDKFHQVSVLYTSDAITAQEAQIISSGTRDAEGLAPMLVAFADVECSGSSLSFQKCLIKASDDQIGKKKRWKKIFKNANKEVENQSISATMVAEFGADP